MIRVASDSLLIATRSLVLILRVLIFLAFAGLCLGVVFSVFAHGFVVAKVIAAGAPVTGAWAITAMLALFAAMLLMAERFLRRLNEIVDSVGAGDPFAPANAARLEQMAWLALSINLVAIPAGKIVEWLDGYVHAFKTDAGFSIGGLVLTLVLFILARVFRQGAAMREELEGTV